MKESNTTGVDERAGPSSAKSDFAHAVLDRMAGAVLVIAPRAQVVFANRAAHFLLGEKDGVRLRHGAREVTLLLEDAAEQRRFESAVEALAGLRPGVRAFVGMRVARPSGRPDFVLQAFAVESRGADEPQVGVFMTDPCERHRLDARILASVYGLTAAEVRLAEALLGDQSIMGIAAAAGIKESTIRSQLLSLFRKTRTARQSQLVKLLMALRLLG